VVAVADPRTDRREALADQLGLSADRRFDDWRDLAAVARFADAVIVTTPDREHVGAACRFAELGYHVLLEKPIAPNRVGCIEVIEAVEKAGVILAVCHVMRYTAYTHKVKEIVANGRLGQIVGVEHLEPIGWWHFAHSFVRGNWRRSDESGPSILTKCCHDLDWLRYIVGRPAVAVSSWGGLHHFTAANRPAGAADRCLDCAVEPDCPYSAARLYLGCLGDPERERWPLSVVTTDLTGRGVRRALREGPYGRCVYACDNDVADHQVVTIDFEGGVTATLTMSAFTPFARRRTRIMGTRSFLDGDGQRVTLTDFVTGEVEVFDLSANGADAGGGHDGGDFGVMSAFVDAVSRGDKSLVRTGPRESLESHLMAFAAERSRLTGAPVRVWD
jgi:predicted dehydrogenase